MSESKMFVNRVEIQQFAFGDDNRKHTFCAEDRAFFPGKRQRVEWKPR